uniref:Uncharacterized protein n=1 Tax=Anopheles atroparvus TaxID=41427 RepID=A0A182J3N7_ANOAO
MTIKTITSSVLLLLACFTASGLYAQRCSCVTGPPDYLCPTAPLLQVYLRHEKFCTRYYKCTEGRAIEFQCPYGTYFDVQNAMCTSDFTLCYRVDPCIQFIDICRCCARQFDNTGLAPPNFYVCLNDGFAEAQTCPLALDPCTNTTIQLEFINQKYNNVSTNYDSADYDNDSANYDNDSADYDNDSADYDND